MIKFKAKVPSSKFRSSTFVSDMRKMGNELAKRVNETYTNEVMATWESKAPFIKEVSATQNLTKVEVKTDSNVYRYLTRGTKEHPISPRPENTRGLLVFQKDFTPKTTVGSLRSKSGGKSGPWAFRKEVMHPGTEARNYESLIIEEQTPWILERFAKTLRESIELRSE